MGAEPAPRDYHHPYEPYEIQKDFMDAVYDCLEQGKVGIFESPTGTGKSLSLICGSLTWLRDHKRRTFEEGLADVQHGEDEPAWMIEHARKQAKHAALARQKELHDRLAKIKAKEHRAKQRHAYGDPQPKRRRLAQESATDSMDEAQFVLDDYESDNESVAQARSTFNDAGISDETRALIEKLGYAVKPGSAQDSEAIDEIKIFFCSRTHSQLTQFSSELTKVKMPPAIQSDTVTSNDADDLAEDVKHLTLGSRKNLCINPKVNRLGSAVAINERCLELQQPKTPSDRKCPFLPTKDTEVVVNDFRDHALAKIRDIEDLGSLGRQLGICPYYASRSAIRSSEFVTLPYPLLLQKSARDALGLSLNGHIIVIDEAHNLMDAIAGIHSISVNLDQLQQGRAQIVAYLQKFRNKLKGKNRVYVAQTVRILDSVIAFLQREHASATTSDGQVDSATLMSGKGVDQINLFKLTSYLQESRLARKVDGYTAYNEVSAAPDPNASTQSARHTIPVLTHIQGFLLSLMNPSAEGRFFFSKEGTSTIALKYMLLDPTYHFKDVVQEARAVVLAGGTMSPMNDYERHLLSYLSKSNIMTLSCGHVIPPTSLLAMPVIEPHRGSQFDFTFEKRATDAMMRNLADALLNVAQHTPDGVVVFFPSYPHLDACVSAWQRMRTPSSNHTSVWNDMIKWKPIFLEQRSQSQSTSDAKSASVESVLSAYTNAVASGQGRGALLFAVIGGSLSEGINFSDALGRGVVVVGLPFPNPHSAEWKAKTEYISAKAISNGEDGKAAARDFYENVCMRAVNQCIGRAIRHRGDYAAILLLDRRYSTQRIQAKLPEWIRGSLTNAASLTDVEHCLDEFFAGKLN